MVIPQYGVTLKCLYQIGEKYRQALGCPGFPESDRLNKRAGNSMEGSHVTEKAHPEIARRTPRARSSDVHGKPFQ